MEERRHLHVRKQLKQKYITFGVDGGNVNVTARLSTADNVNGTRHERRNTLQSTAAQHGGCEKTYPLRRYER